MKILKGNLVSAPALGKLEIVEHGCLVLHDDGSIQSVEKAVPQNADAEVIDYGDSLIMPSFVDMHLHAPQYPMPMPSMGYCGACRCMSTKDGMMSASP